MPSVESAFSVTSPPLASAAALVLTGQTALRRPWWLWVLSRPRTQALAERGPPSRTRAQALSERTASRPPSRTPTQALAERALEHTRSVQSRQPSWSRRKAPRKGKIASARGQDPGESPDGSALVMPPVMHVHVPRAEPAISAIPFAHTGEGSQASGSQRARRRIATERSHVSKRARDRVLAGSVSEGASH